MRNKCEQFSLVKGHSDQPEEGERKGWALVRRAPFRRPKGPLGFRPQAHDPSPAQEWPPPQLGMMGGKKGGGLE